MHIRPLKRSYKCVYGMYVIVFILFFTLNEVVGIFCVHTSLVMGKNANSVYYYNKFKNRHHVCTYSNA